MPMTAMIIPAFIIQRPRNRSPNEPPWPRPRTISLRVAGPVAAATLESGSGPSSTTGASGPLGTADSGGRYTTVVRPVRPDVGGPEADGLDEGPPIGSDTTGSHVVEPLTLGTMAVGSETGGGEKEGAACDAVTTGMAMVGSETVGAGTAGMAMVGSETVGAGTASMIPIGSETAGTVAVRSETVHSVCGRHSAAPTGIDRRSGDRLRLVAVQPVDSGRSRVEKCQPLLDRFGILQEEFELGTEHLDIPLAPRHQLTNHVARDVLGRAGRAG